MADYYPVLARTISGLPSNTAQARKEVYDNARKIVIAQLRAYDPPISSGAMMREQAALESAIGKIEAESRVTRPQSSNSGAPPRASATRVAAMDEGQGKPTAKQLGKIFQELQPYEGREAAAKKSGEPIAAPRQTAPVIREANVRPVLTKPAVLDSRSEPAEEFGGMIESVGSMLLGIPLIVTMICLVGLIYVRGLVLVAKDVIGYPTLVLMMSVAVGLCLVLPLAIFRRLSLESLMRSLLRFLYPAVRRASSDVPVMLKDLEQILRQRVSLIGSDRAPHGRDADPKSHPVE
jgi:hypothetical protein